MEAFSFVYLRMEPGGNFLKVGTDVHLDTRMN